VLVPLWYRSLNGLDHSGLDSRFERGIFSLLKKYTPSPELTQRTVQYVPAFFFQGLKWSELGAVSSRAGIENVWGYPCMAA